MITFSYDYKLPPLERLYKKVVNDLLFKLSTSLATIYTLPESLSKS